MDKYVDKFKYVMSLLRKHGLKGFLIKYYEKRTEKVDQMYLTQSDKYLPGVMELRKQREESKQFAYQPKISIVVPVYRTPERFLDALVESVREQSYENWELCLSDATEDSRLDPEMHRILGSNCTQRIFTDVNGEQADCMLSADGKIRYRRLAHNGGISGNTNHGIAMATGEYIAFVDHDDVLSPNALFENVKAINEKRELQFLYSDEDKIPAEGGMHYEPHFKTDYNEELLNHYNYICHLVVVKRTLIDMLAKQSPTGTILNSSYDGAQDYDFVLRATEALREEEIYHIPKILYHWRVHSNSTAGNSASKDYAYEAGRRAVKAHLERMMGVENAASELEQVEVLAVRGREYVNTLRKNPSLEEAYVLLLGNNVTVVTPDYMERMRSSFVGTKAKVGMVGGKLVSGRRIHSCGIAYKRDGFAFLRFHGKPSWSRCYYRQAAVPQQVSACDLDFALVSKEAYDAVGGINEALSGIERSVDFATKLKNAGYRVILDASVVARCKRRADATSAQVVMQSKDPYLNENVESYMG